MTKIRFVSWAGEMHVVEAEPGMSIMEAAVKNGVPGIIGECGGYCACGTCLAWLEPNAIALTGTRLGPENDMLEFLATEESNARLTCQIRITDEMDGIVITTPNRS